jgi:hypothetical protein
MPHNDRMAATKPQNPFDVWKPVEHKPMRQLPALLSASLSLLWTSARGEFVLVAVVQVITYERRGELDSIRLAAERAGADAFIQDLPAGYRTLLGPEFDGGANLSIGQWQRMALARAFLRDAPLVILDEPTAALDARAEHELFDSMRTLFAGRTVLLISHRFSSVRSADRIFVLDKGQLVEQGSHSQLMRQDGTYAETVRTPNCSPSRPRPIKPTRSRDEPQPAFDESRLTRARMSNAWATERVCLTLGRRDCTCHATRVALRAVQPGGWPTTRARCSRPVQV